MKYAIIKSGGKQHKVSEGMEILVDRLNAPKDSQYLFPEVLLIRSDKITCVGTPLVEKGKVQGKIIGEEKGEKIRVSKFKAKVNFRRTIGFRPIYTKVLIGKIDVGKDKPVKTKEKQA